MNEILRVDHLKNILQKKGSLEKNQTLLGRQTGFRLLLMKGKFLSWQENQAQANLQLQN